MYSCNAVVLPCIAADAAFVAVITSIPSAEDSPIAFWIVSAIWSEVTPIAAASDCISKTCSSPYVVMLWISEARLCIIGSTSDTTPPCERIADATFCTAISCRPNA